MNTTDPFAQDNTSAMHGDIDRVGSDVQEHHYRTYIDKLKKHNGALSLKLTRTRQELFTQRDYWQARAEKAEHHLGELLAVIHRDGGHYQTEHGTDKAVAEAMRLSSIRIDREGPQP